MKNFLPLVMIASITGCASVGGPCPTDQTAGQVIFDPVTQTYMPVATTIPNSTLPSSTVVAQTLPIAQTFPVNAVPTMAQTQPIAQTIPVAQTLPSMQTIYAPTYSQPTATTSVGQNILSTGRLMVHNREVITGNSANYVNALYNRAGYNQQKRLTIFQGSQGKLYANSSTFQPGDWLFFINYSYHSAKHSGVFVRWIDQSRNIAQVLSYPGETRNRPGRYKNYNLSKVYAVIRATH